MRSSRASFGALLALVLGLAALGSTVAQRVDFPSTAQTSGRVFTPRRPDALIFSLSDTDGAVALLPPEGVFDRNRLFTFDASAPLGDLLRALPGELDCALFIEDASAPAVGALSMSDGLARFADGLVVKCSGNGADYAVLKAPEFVDLRRKPSFEELTDPETVLKSREFMRKRSATTREYPFSALEITADKIEYALYWAWTFVTHHWGKLHPFNTYAGTGETGLYSLNTGASLAYTGQPSGNSDDEIRMSMAADWGSGTLESDYVVQLMMNDGFNPHWTVHVGDVYLQGTEDEVRSNCLGQPPPNVMKGVTWPLGSLGGWALNGNHETFSRGYGLFDLWMPVLGVRDPTTGAPQGQKASYFALENEYWRVINLDTGYNTYSKLIESKNNVQPQPVIDWLRDVVQIGNASDTRAILLLSHHQYRSAFDTPYVATPEQIEPLLPANRSILWIYGHEHRLGFYDLGSAPNNTIKAFCRCIGVGGFPPNVGGTPGNPRGAGLMAYDDRQYEILDGLKKMPVGFNGFAELSFQGPKLSITYSSLEIGPNGVVSNTTASQLVSEVFEMDPSSGNVNLVDFTVLNPNITVISHL